MTDIAQKARDMVRKEDGHGYLNYDAALAALCRAIEQHEEFRQEVSDEMEAYSKRCKSMGLQFPLLLERFIINADVPDALVDVWGDLFTKGYNLEQFRAALEARGLEIREKNDDQ